VQGGGDGGEMPLLDVSPLPAGGRPAEQGFHLPPPVIEAIVQVGAASFHEIRLPGTHNGDRTATRSSVDRVRGEAQRCSSGDAGGTIVADVGIMSEGTNAAFQIVELVAHGQNRVAGYP